MSEQQILVPMLGMMVLTAVVWFVMYARRIPAMQRARKPAQVYTTPDKVVDHLPEEVNWSANNLKNLFEIPVTKIHETKVLKTVLKGHTVYEGK